MKQHTLYVLVAVLWIGLLALVLSTRASAQDPQCVCPPPPPCAVSQEVQDAAAEAREALRALSNAPPSK